ncbi:hypothetical protein [Paenibacillus sp. FSL R7-0652]|uniref:LPXTG cell wall anchor domain-containing protein n=1 Tax=Paenibacillus sp. AN1007 TaxID=3151385 RepID=A0AAU8N6T6_9BACL
MRMNKRVGMESLIVALVFLLILVGWNVVEGMFLTMKHVPELQQLHTSGAPSKVEFGSVTSAGGSTIVVGIGMIMLFTAGYYVIRSYFIGKRK